MIGRAIVQTTHGGGAIVQRRRSRTACTHEVNAPCWDGSCANIERKLNQVDTGVRERIGVWLQRAQQVHAQRPKDKQKLYAVHAPEVECIGKGKARQPYEFGVKVRIAVTACNGLVVGARSFPGNPYDGDTLNGAGSSDGRRWSR